jgi:hypothetical protein
VKKLVIFILALIFLSSKPAFNQQVFELNINQPPLFIITISETVDATVGEVVNLDSWFHVEGDISYNREWKFRYGSFLQTLDNPVFTITSNGVFYLIVINENDCTVLDSITLNIVTGVKDINTDRDNSHSIQIYPNPNSGSFDIKISDCQPGFSVEIINSLGVRLFSKTLNCDNNAYSGTIMLPERESGTCFLLIKKGNKIIYRQKVIILK